MSDVAVHLRATKSVSTPPGDPAPGTKTPTTHTPDSPGSLPFTGSDLALAATTAAVLLVIGALLVTMSRTGSRIRRANASRRNARLRAGVVAAAVVAVAAASSPVWADESEGVTVSLSTTAGTRQFAVQDLAGDPLTSLDLGGGGAAPFRVVVTDDNFTGLDSGFQVDAVMNNLYRKTGGGHAFDEKIPSSQVSLSYGGTPLNASDVSFLLQPVFALTGSIPSCAGGGLLDVLTDALGAPAAASLLASADGLALCSALGAGGATVNTTVQGLINQVTAPLSSLTDLPTGISGNEPGPFTKPDFANGIGAGDTAGASGAPSPTALSVMTGTPLSDLPTALLDAIDDVLGGLPLTVPGDNGALAGVSDVVAALAGAANPATAAVGQALGALDATDASAILAELTATLVPPTLANLLSLDGTYKAFPVLHASAAGAPVPGDYEGTLTLTFVQQ